MTGLVSSFARVLVIVAAAALVGSAADRAPSLQPGPSIGEDPAARMGPEVRLRKLHLVRPDLIPYPLSYEIYC